MKSVLSILLATCAVALQWGRGTVVAQYQPTAQYQPPAPFSQGSLPPSSALQRAQDPPAVAPAQVPEIWLMLKNGSTFSARMLSAGERVRLRVNEGDIEIRASEIALTGHSLSDLAEQQWATLHQQFLDKQIPFIDWCTRHHLYDIADTALLQMAEKGQDPPRVAGYQTRVKRLREIHQEQLAFQAAQTLPAPQVTAQPALQTPIAAPQSALATSMTAPPTQVLPAQATAPLIAPHADTFPSTTAPGTATLLLPAKPLGPATTTLPAAAAPSPVQPSPVQPSPVQPAAYQPLEIPREQTSTAKEPAINSPHPATLPSAAVELFTARVQPWVVSRCSGCHDMQSPHSFKLERYSKQEGVTRATTLKNLAATTRLVDKDKPAESPLLVMSARAHGTSPLPPITAGDAAAMAAFREFVALATGRELPKPTKPDPTSANSLRDQPGHVTPGRATFPASAVDEPATEDKTAAALKQTGPGWQAAIERQKAYDTEAQKLRDLQTSSQQANAARGLITDPAVQPAMSTVQPAVSTVLPAVSTVQPTTAIAPSAAPAVPATTLPLPPTMLIPSTAAAMQPARTLLLEPTTSVASPLTTPPTTSSTALTAPVVTQPSVPQLNTLPPSPLPESLLPKSLAAKPKVDPALEAALETVPESPTHTAMKSGEGKPPLPNLGTAGSAPAKPTPPININRPRRQFPLPPEDKPPSKGVGTGEIKRR